MKRILTLLILAASCCGPRDGEYALRVLTTNDVHGRYFDSLYVEDGLRNSLISASWYVDSVRTAAGKENVLLVDVGDFLQGDNAAYYYNYVDTLSEHIYARMAEYMGYDAVVVGNHDVETGHAVYDRLGKQMDIPLLASNAIRTEDGKVYFQEYTIVRRHGLKIAVIGFTNPGIPGWLAPELWDGMEFKELIPFAQEVVDRVRKNEEPDVVIVAVHGGAGSEEYKYIENPGMALFGTLTGVDLLLCAHDHRPVVHDADSIAMVNAGSHCKYLGCGVVNVSVKGGKVVAKSSDAALIPIRPENVDVAMREKFKDDFDVVKAFTIREVGHLDMPLNTVDAYGGMSDYINLIHAVSIVSAPQAKVSFAAPLTYNGSIPAGTIVYNDLFTIYPFENQLYVLEMTGKEIKDYLEYSYDSWINTYKAGQPHLLKIRNSSDPRTGQKKWSFVSRSYNFDSAGGLIYEVDVTKTCGDRVTIRSFADGTPFSEDAAYNVAMTSYRANGGGGILKDGAGIDAAEAQNRIVARYPEIREMLYDYVLKHGKISRELVGDPKLIGQWQFVPEKMAQEAISADLDLMFKK